MPFVHCVDKYHEATLRLSMPVNAPNRMCLEWFVREANRCTALFVHDVNGQIANPAIASVPHRACFPGLATDQLVYKHNRFAHPHGWNNYLVRRLTEHELFHAVVKSAKRQLLARMPSLRPDQTLVILVRCNGGKQRSVGVSRMLSECLEERGASVHSRFLASWRFCGCQECQGDRDDVWAQCMDAWRAAWRHT
jgi:hypothetical protein